METPRPSSSSKTWVSRIMRLSFRSQSKMQTQTTLLPSISLRSPPCQTSSLLCWQSRTYPRSTALGSSWRGYRCRFSCKIHSRGQSWLKTPSRSWWAQSRRATIQCLTTTLHTDSPLCRFAFIYRRCCTSASRRITSSQLFTPQRSKPITWWLGSHTISTTVSHH